MNPVLTMTELKNSYIESKLQTDPESDREVLEKEFNRAVLRYLHLTFKDLEEYINGISLLVPALENEFAFMAGFMQGAVDEFSEQSLSSDPTLKEFERV